MTKIIKKDGSHELFNEEKIIKAVKKSAERVMIPLNDNQLSLVCMNVKDLCTIYCIQNETDYVPVSEVHKMVEKSLSKVDQDVAESYRSYRNYKTDFVQMLDDVYKKAQSIMYLGDKENSNSDSSLVSTKRSLIAGELSKELYQKFFLTSAERKAAKEGFIYIHDMRDRLYTLNCFDVDTKFITSEGVKSFRDYKDGDIVYVPTHTGSWKKAIVKNYGENDLYEVKLKRGGWTEKTVVVTRDHRWILKNGEVTTNLSVGDKLISTPNISKFEWEHLSLEQKRLWCLGFAYGDGREIFENNKHVVSVRLCNRKNQYKDKFLEAGFSVTQPKCLVL
jgi:transcriptional regulator NrdR family protein